MEIVAEKTLEERILAIEASQEAVVAMLKDVYRETRPMIVGNIAALNEHLRNAPLPKPPYWVVDETILNEAGGTVLVHGPYRFVTETGEIFFGEDDAEVGTASTTDQARGVVEDHKKSAAEASEQ